MELRVAPGLRLAGNAFVIVWSSAVAVVLLETRDLSTLGGLLLASSAFALAIRPVFGMRVTATSEGLVVDNGFRSRMLPWGTISGLRVESSSFSGRVVVMLTTGTQLPLRVTRVVGPASRRRRRLRAIRDALWAAAPGD